MLAYVSSIPDRLMKADAMYYHRPQQDSVAELRRLERWFEVMTQRHNSLRNLRRLCRQSIVPATVIFGGIAVVIGLSNAFPRVPTLVQDFAVFYANCDVARDSGHAPLYRHGPGYRPGLDPDGDGVACEPLANRQIAETPNR